MKYKQQESEPTKKKAKKQQNCEEDEFKIPLKYNEKQTNQIPLSTTISIGFGKDQLIPLSSNKKTKKQKDEDETSSINSS